MTQVPTPKVSRQVRRAQERAIIRRTMTKKERRFYVRMSSSVRREIYLATLGMVANGQLQPRR